MKILIALYIVTLQNVKTHCTKKNAKITKQSYAYRDYAKFYNVDLLNSFNPDLEL